MAEWLFNSELPSLKESEMSKYRLFKHVLICLLPLPLLCVFHLWFKRYRRHVYNDVTRDYLTCSLTLRRVTENRYVKCPVHFFGWNIFHLLSYEQNLLTNRIAGKLMNISKNKLYVSQTYDYTKYNVHPTNSHEDTRQNQNQLTMIRMTYISYAVNVWVTLHQDPKYDFIHQLAFKI